MKPPAEIHPVCAVPDGIAPDAIPELHSRTTPNQIPWTVEHVHLSWTFPDPVDPSEPYQNLCIKVGHHCREGQPNVGPFARQVRSRRERKRFCLPRPIVGAHLVDLQADAVVATYEDSPRARAFVEALVSGELLDALSLVVVDGVVTEVVRMPVNWRGLQGALGTQLRKRIFEVRATALGFQAEAYGLAERPRDPIMERLNEPATGYYKLMRHGGWASAGWTTHEFQMRRMLGFLRRRRNIAERYMRGGLLADYLEYRKQADALDREAAERLARTLAA